MAVKTLLLAFLILGLSGAKIEASEPQLVTLGAKSAPKCTSLNSYFVTNFDNCEDRKLTQKENALIEAVNNNNNPELVTFAYATESVYYVDTISEAEPTPTVAQTLNTSPIPAGQSPPPGQSPSGRSLSGAQEPRDLFPADGPNLDSNVIFDLINTHRASIGKKSFEKEGGLCSLATVRSVELHDELFKNGNLHSGLYNRNLPYWITENAKWGSNESGTVRWWLNSPIHRRAIEGDYTYSCGACNGTQCAQLFTSYTPK